jgi:hypothetical protein
MRMRSVRWSASPAEGFLATRPRVSITPNPDLRVRRVLVDAVHPACRVRCAVLEDSRAEEEVAHGVADEPMESPGISR